MNPLRSLLLLVAFYFICMSGAHFFGLKYPLLFVYYDTPFYAYQDRIISFTIFSYALFFLAAARHRVVVPYALGALWVTILGLAYINQSAELLDVLNDGSTLVYWLQTAGFALLAAALTYLSLRKKP